MPDASLLFAQRLGECRFAIFVSLLIVPVLYAICALALGIIRVGQEEDAPA